MEKLSEIRVTRFEHYKSKKGSSIFMFEELRHIKLGTYKLLVSKCREVYDLDKILYTKLKNKLPAVTFSGEFEKGRKASEITKYNDLIIIDIDKLSYEDLLEKKKILSQDMYVLSFWESPSGRGLKCLIRVGGGLEKHKAVFNSLKKYFIDNFQIELDISGKDVSRLCFSSWDEDIFYNPKAEIYFDYLEDEAKEEKEGVKLSERKVQDISLLKSAYATEGLNKKDDRETIRKITKFLIKKNLSITDSYDAWLKVAFAIASAFSFDLGEKYFLTLCRMDKSKHNEEESINLLKSCYNKREFNTSGTVSFASVIFLAKSKGFRI